MLHPCRTGKHLWTSKADAAKCCNGWHKEPARDGYARDWVPGQHAYGMAWVPDADQRRDEP